MKLYFLLITLVLILISCTNDFPRQQLKNTNSFDKQIKKFNYNLFSKNYNDQLLLPKITIIDWRAILLPMLLNMASTDYIDGKIILYSIQNNSNIDLETNSVNCILNDLMIEINSNFHIINLDAIKIARQKLGLSSYDNLESCSKAIGLARYLNAKFLLYSKIIGCSKYPKIELQLILVKNGEIIWSEKKYLFN